jgi:hypothetical protein
MSAAANDEFFSFSDSSVNSNFNSVSYNDRLPIRFLYWLGKLMPLIIAF